MNKAFEIKHHCNAMQHRWHSGNPDGVPVCLPMRKVFGSAGQSQQERLEFSPLFFSPPRSFFFFKSSRDWLSMKNCLGQWISDWKSRGAKSQVSRKDFKLLRPVKVRGDSTRVRLSDLYVKWNTSPPVETGPAGSPAQGFSSNMGSNSYDRGGNHLRRWKLFHVWYMMFLILKGSECRQYKRSLPEFLETAAN